AGVGDDGAGVAAVAGPAGEGRGVAEVFLPLQAVAAVAAGRAEPGNAHAQADQPGVDARARRIDEPDDLVARHDGHRAPGQLAVDHVQVGAADPAGGHAQAKLARPGLWIWALDRLERPVRRGEGHGEHGRRPRARPSLGAFHGRRSMLRRRPQKFQEPAMNAPTTIDDEVLYAVDGHVATITLNRPDRMNTISRAMLGQLTEHLLAADADPEVRVVILTGTGRAFCAGLDLTEATGQTQGGISNSGGLGVTLDLRNTPPTVLFNMDTPVICALNGSAAGYGMDTALGCDIRIMAQSAKMAAAFTKRGVVPESGGTWFLPRLLGW